jgi:Flp pilus assembly protein TadG
MRRRSRGNMAIEAALFIPVMVLLIVGMVQFGKITYQYYALKKIVYAAARQLSVAQGINFCDLASDVNAQAALTMALNDSTGAPLFPTLTADMLQISPFCNTAIDSPPSACENAGCPVVAQRPDYIQVTIPNGFQVNPRIPAITLQPILLRPSIMVPFGGTS